MLNFIFDSSQHKINVCPREEIFGPDAMFDWSWYFAGHGEIILALQLLFAALW